MEEAAKRLFFGLEVISPWPEKYPMGRLLDEKHRHLTVAFLGSTDWDKLSNALASIPPPPFKVGLAGQFDQCQFLPKRHSNVVAWHVHWLDDYNSLLHYQKEFTLWLFQQGFSPSQPDRAWLPHVTLCRKPFNARLWNDTFTPLPMIFKNLNLYESVGNLKYEAIWHYPLLPSSKNSTTPLISRSISTENLPNKSITMQPSPLHSPSPDSRLFYPRSRLLFFRKYRDKPKQSHLSNRPNDRLPL